MESFLRRKSIGSLINGEYLDGKTFSKPMSLADGSPLPHIIDTPPDALNLAVSGTREALLFLKTTTAHQRASWLEKAAILIEENKEQLATIVAHEIGVPIKFAKMEVQYSAGFFAFFAKQAIQTEGYFIPSSHPKKTVYVRKEPIGICLGITPWNFPTAMPARKIAPAIAAGCPILIVGSDSSPLSLLAMGSLLLEAGIPPEALQLLIGNNVKIVKHLMEKPEIRKASFTGSTAVGKIIDELSVPTLKKLTLELGGNAPSIIFEDADIDKAVDEVIRSKFRLNGQTCICMNRLLVHQQIHSSFTELLRAKTEQLVVGAPLDPNTDVSHALHPTSLKKSATLRKSAIKEGLLPLIGAKHPYEPEYFLNMTKDNTLFHEEVFGPTMGIATFEEIEEAVHLANHTEFGLAAYLFTKDLGKALHVSPLLNFGTIGINDGAPSAPEAILTGRKMSGFGVEGGAAGLEEFLIDKMVSILA